MCNKESIRHAVVFQLLCSVVDYIDLVTPTVCVLRLYLVKLPVNSLALLNPYLLTSVIIDWLDRCTFFVIRFILFLVVIVGYKLLQNCSSWGYKQNNYIFRHRKICLTRPDIFTFENPKKKFCILKPCWAWLFPGRLCQIHQGFLQTIPDLKRKLATCTTIKMKFTLKILLLYQKHWPCYDFSKFPLCCEIMQWKIVHGVKIILSRELHGQ